MIRRAPNGKHYCDGKECGYPLAYFPGDPEEGEPGQIVCLDCNTAIHADKDPAAEQSKEDARG
jgi:hypothetical protein